MHKIVTQNAFKGELSVLEEYIFSGIEKYYVIQDRNDDDNSYYCRYEYLGLSTDYAYYVNFYRQDYRGFFQDFILNELEYDDKRDILTYNFIQMNKSDAKNI